MSTIVNDFVINSSGHIFAGTLGGGVFLSMDNGSSWTPVNIGLTNTDVLCLAINSTGHIFAGTSGSGVFRSTDNGSSWMPANVGLTSLDPQNLAINVNGHVFAGMYSSGVFRSTDNGNSWKQVNSGLANTYVWSLGINTGGYVFAGTYGGGVYRSVESTIDQSAPQITHSAITSAQSGQSQTILANITDNFGIQSAKLYYRRGGSTFFDSTAMINTSDDNYQGTIPASFMTERGAEYYISVADGAGNKSTFPATNPQTKPQVIQVTNSNFVFPFANPTPAKIYRMISVPFELNDKSVASVLEDELGRYDDTQWRLLRYLNGGYVEYGASGFSNFAPGNGFWLITKEAKSLDAGAGKSVTTVQNYAITLQPGWNQIGNPFHFTVNWSDVIKNASVGDSLVGYQGSSNNSTGYDFTRKQLMPGEGYFVHNRSNSPTTIEIPPNAAVGTRETSAPHFKNNEWMLQITAVSGHYLDKDNYIGCFYDAAEAWDSHDFPEAPFFADHVALYFPHPEWEKYPDLYTGDFRGVKSAGDYWDFVVKSEVGKSEAARFEVILSLAEVQNLPANWQIILLDKASRVAVNFVQQKKYTFLPEVGKAVREFRIVVGQKDFVEDNDLNLAGIPQDFKLSQNYPNPFNPETHINYELPSMSSVKISIFDLKGQLIRMLVDGQQSAGRYVVSWDGKTDNGKRAASGVYLVQMKAKGFLSSKKMILAK